MRTPRLVGTATFRLALLYGGLFGASVLVLFGFLYWSTVALLDRQIEQTIEAEIRGLDEQYRGRGLGRLIQAIGERSANPANRTVYLLTDPALRRLAGNLDAWPSAAGAAGTWVKLDLERRAGDEAVPHEVRARAFTLRGGFRLIVGRDDHDVQAFRGVAVEALAWSLAATLGLGLVGGLVMSRNLLRRVDAIAATSRDIIRGDLTRRMPERGSGDEFDRLSQSLNAMLGRIEELMVGLRAVTDSIAHDLRSPLTRLKSRIELALREAPDAALYRRTLEETLAETDAVLATFSALLAIGRAESGASRAEMTELDLAALAAEVAELYQPAAEEKGLRFEFRAEGEAPIRGHRQLLAQALGNLLDNAIKYTPAGGRVEFAVAREGNRPRVVVADDGPGIPAADRTRVLDRFVRLDQSRSTPGSGLGLALAAAVAKLHGARLDLADNRPGLKVTLEFETAPPGAQPGA